MPDTFKTDSKCSCSDLVLYFYCNLQVQALKEFFAMLTNVSLLNKRTCNWWFFSTDLNLSNMLLLLRCWPCMHILTHLYFRSEEQLQYWFYVFMTCSRWFCLVQAYLIRLKCLLLNCRTQPERVMDLSTLRSHMNVLQYKLFWWQILCFGKSCLWNWLYCYFLCICSVWKMWLVWY